MLKTNVLTTLKSHCQVDDSILKCIEENFNNLEDPFQNLSKEYKRFKYFESNASFIQPRDYIIRCRNKEKNINGSIILEPTSVIGKFIPLRDVFKIIFEIPGVYSKIKSYMENLYNEKDTYFNFVQGELWQEKIKVYQNANKFVIFSNIFFDDYETGNALGSHSGKNKVGAVCFHTLHSPAISSSS